MTGLPFRCHACEIASLEHASPILQGMRGCNCPTELSSCVQLPQHVDLPAFQLPAAPHLPEVNFPDISGGLDMRTLQEAAAGLAEVWSLCGLAAFDDPILRCQSVSETLDLPHT